VKPRRAPPPRAQIRHRPSPGEAGRIPEGRDQRETEGDRGVIRKAQAGKTKKIPEGGTPPFVTARRAAKLKGYRRGGIRGRPRETGGLYERLGLVKRKRYRRGGPLHSSSPVARRSWKDTGGEGSEGDQRVIRCTKGSGW